MVGLRKGLQRSLKVKILMENSRTTELPVIL